MTSRVASVPPVEAPRPTITRSRTGRSRSWRTPSWGLHAPLAAAAVCRTLAKEATITFWARESMNTSRLWVPSGLRTKSTAPAASASKTRRFREETRMTGSGYLGSSSLSSSIPLLPGISTSSVMTSGRSSGTLLSASAALTA